MFSVYGLLCDGLRDPRGTGAAPALSWRLGSDRTGCRQATWRVVVTSADDGRRAWDSGEVAGDRSFVAYGGDALAPGETCVWFVSVTDEAGERADSVPASFAVAREGERCVAEAGPERRALVWTSDDTLNRRLEALAEEAGVWESLFGLVVGRDATYVRFAPKLAHGPARGLTFAQLSLLMPRGLVVARWEVAGEAARLGLSLPPGMGGRMALGEKGREVLSGRHELVAPYGEAPGTRAEGK